jgi:hypothetical protein
VKTESGFAYGTPKELFQDVYVSTSSRGPAAGRESNQWDISPEGKRFLRMKDVGSTNVAGPRRINSTEMLPAQWTLGAILGISRDRLILHPHLYRPPPNPGFLRTADLWVYSKQASEQGVFCQPDGMAPMMLKVENVTKYYNIRVRDN